MLYRGTVKFFDRRAEKKYGFVIVEGNLSGSPQLSLLGREIFFHYNDGQYLTPGEEKPKFTGSGTMERKGKRYHLKDPQKGDVLIFELAEGSKGKKASPWCFFELYENIQEVINKRPAYRVMNQYTTYGNPPGEPTVLWEGKSIAELAKKHPRYDDRRYDDLGPTFSCSDFDQRIWFERQTETGWEKCQDPRPKGPLNPRWRTF